ncbi:adenylate kinase [Candidatus Woesearchaeota archaeon CG_4_10_14_0_2_um_filter_57_5]|nr:MAG: adenylate kinase [Candidatus Woesearchaeota archaeon CG11_big_fil_rev_8_21_14_0_20_57_5]PIZ48631.1 MAG: adenylate kinase [Candidatus Woesearchaeota archaeon CG_4_10_14_0_2_um_filter_57_5]
MFFKHPDHTDPMKQKAILLFGPPGCGKGTQGKLLAEEPGYFHFSTGDMFRSLEISTPTGAKVKGFMDKRELVPDEVTLQLVQETIGRYIQEGRMKSSDTILLDGLPRNEAQVPLVNALMDVTAILYFDVPKPELLVDRMTTRAQKEGRTDDKNPDVVMRGIQIYYEQTQKVLKLYPDGLVHRIDAMGSIEDVHNTVLRILKF